MSVIEFAEKRMMEEEKAGEEKNVLYWSAYLDGARAQKKEDEPKHGEWIYSGEQDDEHNNYCHCSVCGAGDIHAIKGTVPHCWWCGAKMEVQE